MTGLVACLAAGAAVHLLVGVSPGVARAGRRTTIRPATWAAIGAGPGVLVAVTLLHGTRVVLGLVVVAALLAVSRALERRRRLAAAERRADLVLAACEGLASDLQAGQPPLNALVAAADDWVELVPVAIAAELGADVPAAMRVLAARPGAGQLRVVAAAWQVAHRSGAGLSGALAMAAGHLRDDRATARVVATELAAAQATARLLVGLPVLVLLVGSSLGGDPVGFLLDTGPGLVCLCSGLALEYAGLAWLAHITEQATGRRRR